MGSIITLMTDFGTQDGYVGQMKGVIISINPEAQLIDIAHDISTFSILQAALVLKAVAMRFPNGTTHLVVIDPGVGSNRRPIAVRCNDSFYVGPDNGVLWPAISIDDNWEARDLSQCGLLPENPSSTFHGRDIFAVVAGHISKGIDFKSLGPIAHNLVKQEFPEIKTLPSGIVGEVIHVDRFGNLMTNIEANKLDKKVKGVIAGDVTFKDIKKYFSEVSEGEGIAMINSFGYLEIAVNKGRADEKLKMYNGSKVYVKWS